MEPTKLDPANIYTIVAHYTDQLEVWPSPFRDDRQNLTLKNDMGKPILSIYSLTHDQLSALYSEIGNVLTEAQRSRSSEPH